jgi:hypothetical protein
VSGTEPAQRPPVSDAWLIDDSGRVVGNPSLIPARHSILRAFAGLLCAFACFEDFVAFLVADLDARRFPGTFPILGSPARTRSQACSAASSESCASAGRSCQPVTFFPNTWLDFMLGNSRRRLPCVSRPQSRIGPCLIFGKHNASTRSVQLQGTSGLRAFLRRFRYSRAALSASFSLALLVAKCPSSCAIQYPRESSLT